MALDPRSRERLEALGRTLPKALPAPEPLRPAGAEAPRHAVETEENPEQLFRELMGASADGSVPPHLLDRLRQLEKQRQSSRQAPQRLPFPPPGSAGAPAASGGAATPTRRRNGPGPKNGNARRAPAPGSEEAELYTSFAQLLLEDDELD